MDFEFMTADTVLPPCMPLPTAMLRLPVSSTAKVMYARLLDATLAGGDGGYQRDTVCPFPHCEAGSGLVPQFRDRQAFLERIGGCRTDPAGAPGCGRTEPYLHAAPQEGGLP